MKPLGLMRASAWIVMIIAAAALAQPARAELISGARAKQICATHDVGKLTPYGELPEEAAAKRTVFEWNCMTQVERKPKEAFDKYLSPNWCDHGHLVTHAKKPCATREETLVFFARMNSQPLADTDMIEFPTMASVDGDHVTMYGAGVDIFRVVDGRITDHWDASPPDAISLKAHPPGTAERVMRGEGPPAGGP
jgi:predicted SnoaL-like aldol condensation-catalyzing enzyme